MVIVFLLLLSIGLLGIATAKAQIRAYVAHAGDTSTPSGTVSVIDTATNTVVATIPVGPILSCCLPFGIAIRPDGTQAYVTNAGDPYDVANGTVAVIDTASNTVVATIPVGIIPDAVAFTPDGARAYVGNKGSNTVSVIDTATKTVGATIAGVAPGGIAITPDGTRAYVTNEGGASVSVIDTGTNTVVMDINVGAEPAGVAITPEPTWRMEPTLASQSLTLQPTLLSRTFQTLEPLQ
jgi:YVTN family beta-propeller protein